jgi:hypothetical protein
MPDAWQSLLTEHLGIPIATEKFPSLGPRVSAAGLFFESERSQIALDLFSRVRHGVRRQESLKLLDRLIVQCKLTRRMASQVIADG